MGEREILPEPPSVHTDETVTPTERREPTALRSEGGAAKTEDDRSTVEEERRARLAALDRSVETVVPDMPDKPTAGADARLPDQVGRYHVLRRLGAGGMAEVFLAERRADGFAKKVVVKRVLPHLAAEQRFRDLLAREARIAARIHHPNVVHTWDFDVDGDDPFIVMEFVEGLTLRALSRQTWSQGRSLPLELVVGAVADAAEGLDHVHNLCDEQGRPLGLIHRDISPDNLMLSAQGRCRVLDFGIAKVAGGTAFTSTGEVKGKVAFMSPEQVRGDTIDHRTDLYALGVSLYVLLTGAPPFGASEGGGMSNQILVATAVQTTTPPAPSTKNPHVPPALDTIVMSLLEKDAALRPSSGAELADRLRAVVPSSQVVTVRFIERQLAEPPVVDLIGGDGGPTLPEGVFAAEPEVVRTPVEVQASAPTSPDAIAATVPLGRTWWAAAGALLSGLLVFVSMGGLSSDESAAQQGLTSAVATTPVASTPQGAVDPPAHGDRDLDGAATGSADTPGTGGAPGSAGASDGAAERAQPQAASTGAGSAAAGEAPSGPKRGTGQVAAESQPQRPAVESAARPSTTGSPTVAERRQVDESPRPAARARTARSQRVRTTAPRQVVWKTVEGKVLGRGSDTLEVPRGASQIVAVDEATGGRSMVAVRSRVSFSALPQGKLDVRAFPFAEVWLGKRKLGSTPLDPVSLPVGSYTVRLVHEGETKTERVQVREGRTEKVKAAFRN